MASKVENVQGWHPLFQKDIREIGSWEEWKGRWEKAALKEELLGLLHCGFSVKHTSDVERACLYLEVADGYRDKANFELEVEKEPQGVWRQKRLEPEMRLEVAQKALRMLVDKLFTNTYKPLNPYAYEHPSWAGAVTFPAVLEKIFWFFGADRFSYLQECNLPGLDSEKHDDVVLRQFIKDLVVFCWQFHGFDGFGHEKDNPIIIKALENHRPQLLELMYATNQLWYLVGQPRSLDKNSIGKLHEIALRERCGKGPYATLEEAWMVGERLAAMILLLDPIWKKEFARQEKLKEAEKLQQQAKWLMREAGSQ